MTELFDLKQCADRTDADQIITRLRGHEPITRRHLNDAMTAAFGASDANGKWTQRDSFEIVEHATLLYLRGVRSPKRLLLPSPENANHVAICLSDTQPGKIGVVRTCNPLQPLRVCTTPRSATMSRSKWSPDEEVDYHDGPCRLQCYIPGFTGGSRLPRQRPRT